MPFHIIQEAPEASNFTSLDVHQAETPQTFFSETPVLHFHDVASRLVLTKSQLEKLPIFPTPADLPQTEPQSQTNGDTGPDSTGSTEVSIPNIGVWVTSRNLQLFNAQLSKGIIVPYSAISLHAIQSIKPPNESVAPKAIYLQLSLAVLQDDSNVNAADEGAYEDDDILELSIIPSAQDATDDGDTGSSSSRIEDFFNALSTCSNLNPDTHSDEDDPEILTDGATGDGGLPPPFPGSGGWITSENMHEYFDEDGNFIGHEAGEEEVEELGQGAGTVRGREQDDTDEGNGEGDETKWRRTE